MNAPIEFYFDFSSPYGYFAAHKIDEIGEGFGRTVTWKPILLGAVFKTTGMGPLIEQPLRGEYAVHDWERMARYMDVPWTLPDPFPISTVNAARAFYWLDDKDSQQARLLAKTLFDTYFGRGQDIGAPETVADIAAALFANKDEVLTALKDPAIKQRVRDETDRAIERGVFGSPFIVVDGEGFWGSDRLWMVKKWLQKGGW